MAVEGSFERTKSGAKGSAMMLPSFMGPLGRKVKFGARRYDFLMAGIVASWSFAG